jgi:hypothetical protein
MKKVKRINRFNPLHREKQKNVLFAQKSRHYVDGKKSHRQAEKGLTGLENIPRNKQYKVFTH